MTDYINWIEKTIAEKCFQYYEFTDFVNKIELGTGAYSTIYRTKWKYDDRFCILKFYHEDCLEKLVHELEIYQKVNSHPNIIHLYGITKRIGKSKYGLVLEYADMLETYLSHHFNELTWHDKFELAFQLASVVSYLHKEDIVHCNLQPGNILVHQKNIKIVSFSVSKNKNIGEESSDKSRIVGPIDYIDPNLLNNENYKLNKKSDVYSIGVLLWKISSGYKPSYDACGFATTDETIIDEIPVDYSNLCIECWQYDPDKRPDMQQVVLALNRLKSPEILLKKLFGDSQEEEKHYQPNNATEWIQNALKSRTVNFIPFNELKKSESPESLYKGGFGSVVKSIWNKTNSYVVYKRLTNTAAVKNDILDAFIHELQIHLHLDYSERIIRCLGISQDEITKEYLLVMQYADGGDLQNYLKRNFVNLTWNDKKRLAYQIADGLNYLHNENILHRDLHSRNIVIHENNAKITDFGIAKLQNDLNSTAYMGTFGCIAYMEPKRILDPKFPYTKSSDIYSFGVIMWEISSGHPPFKDCMNNNEKFALALAINNGTREATIPDTPKEYEELYKNCWDQKPENRPTISKILDEFAKMGFGIDIKNELTGVELMEMNLDVKNTENNSIVSSELQFNSSIKLNFADLLNINNSVRDDE